MILIPFYHKYFLNLSVQAYKKCRRRGSNPQGLLHTHLKRTCLPISPLRQNNYYSIFTIFVDSLWWKVLSHSSRKTWHLVTFCSAEYQLRQNNYYSIFTIFVGLLWWKVLSHPSLKTWYLVTFCSAEYQLRQIYFIFLKNSSDISWEYLFFSLADIKSLCLPSFVCATETIPPTSPIGSFFTLASNFT